ncbi:MAG TPA: Calx-beta domain-containing protein, partial [Pyrinomonadaceae bacterium]
MATSPQSGRRPASARRQTFAVLTAAFLLLQQAIIFAPAASAQLKRATKLDAPSVTKATKTPAEAPSTKLPAPALDDPLPNDTGSGSISLAPAGSPVSQTFNALATSGTTNTALPNGWYITEGGNGTRDNEAYGADNGGSSTGDIYSYGTAGTPPSTERALGELRSGTLVPLFGAKFTNDTGAPITALEISYTGEQWRIGNTAAARDDRLDFQYSLNATDLSTGTWTDVNALDFTNPVKTAAAVGALDGNSAANRTGLTAQILNLNIPNGASFFVRWTDLDASGSDDGLAVDDFIITAQPAVIAPSLAVNDVSQDEGNAGTTAFTFTVSLNDTQHDGVTFNWSTADGSAVAPGDYTAVTGGTGSIAAGTDSTTITVNVNGDTADELAENFFVNLSNVNGAVVADGQGQGTIVNDDFTLTPIYDIQGSTPTATGNADSPKLGQNVTTTGIVTLLKTGQNTGATSTANGFFMQDPAGDGNTDTSDGIFVFTSSVPTVNVGDSVRVAGTVQEFNGLTELGSVTNVAVLSTGNPVPDDIQFTPNELPADASPTQPQLEKYEGMRVCSATGGYYTVAPNDNFYDVYAVLLGVERPLREPGIEVTTPVPPDPGEATPDPNVPRWDGNPERLKIDTNGRAGAANMPYTSNVAMSVTGPLDYACGEYRLVAESDLSASPNMEAVAAPAPEADEFTVASYNIENFNNNTTQKQKAALTIRDQLHLPDIVGTVEIFDLADLQALADEIESISGETYEARLVEANGAENDNDQDVGFLVKTSRVTINSVTQERAAETYNVPGGGTATLHDRPPLVLDATVDPSGAAPQHVIVVVNHLRSFICIEADVDPAVAAGCTNGAADGPRVREKRRRQAESIAGLLQELQTNNPGVPVISVGDYNA